MRRGEGGKDRGGRLKGEDEKAGGGRVWEVEEARPGSPPIFSPGRDHCRSFFIAGCPHRRGCVTGRVNLFSHHGPIRPHPAACPFAPPQCHPCRQAARARSRDRKSTRLNSSHQIISYAVFCLKKKNSILSGDAASR